MKQLGIPFSEARNVATELANKQLAELFKSGFFARSTAQ
jgi:hypothetical protein